MTALSKKLTWQGAAGKVLPVFDKMTDAFAKHAINTLLYHAPRIVLGGMALAFLAVMVLGIYSTGDASLKAFGTLGGALCLYMILTAITPEIRDSINPDARRLDDGGYFAFVGAMMFVIVVPMMLAATMITNDPAALMYIGVQAIVSGGGVVFGVIAAFEIVKAIGSVMFIAFAGRQRGELQAVKPGEHPDSVLKIADSLYPVNTSVADAAKKEFRKEQAVFGGMMLVGGLLSLLMFALYVPDSARGFTNAIGALGMLSLVLMGIALSWMGRRFKQMPQDEARHRLAIGDSQYAFINVRRNHPAYARFEIVPYMDVQTDKRGTQRKHFYGWKVKDTNRKRFQFVDWADTEYRAYRICHRILEREAKEWVAA